MNQRRWLAMSAAVGLGCIGQSAQAQDQTLAPVGDVTTGGVGAAGRLNGRYFGTGTTSFNSTAQFDFSGTPGGTRTENLGATAPQLNITFNSTNLPPGVGVGTLNGTNVEKFAAQYLGKLDVAAAGNKTFTLASDDGSRLFIDGVLIINNEGGQGASATISGTANLTAGLHDVRVDYVQGGGGAIVRFGVPTTGVGVFTTGATNAYEADVAVAANTTTTAGAPFTLQLNNPHLFSSVGVGTLTATSGATLNVTGFDTGTASAASIVGKTLRYATTDFSALLGAADSFVVNSAGNTAVGVATGGAVGSTVTNAGTGRLIFDNTASANTIASTIVAQGGSIVAVGRPASSNPLGTAAISLNGGGLILDSKGGSVTFDNAVSVVAAAANIDVIPDNVTLTLGSAANGVSIPGGSTLTVNTYANSQNLNVTGSVLQISGAISGGGNLVKNDLTVGGNGNPGILILSNALNSYTGTTTIASGELRVNAANGLGATSGLTIAAGATLNLAVANATSVATPSFVIPATGTLKIGNATALNTNATLNPGTTLINGAVIELNSAANGAGTISRGAGVGFLTHVYTNANALTGAQYTPAFVQAGDQVQLGADNITNLNNVTPAAVFIHSGNANRTQNVTLTLNRDPSLAINTSGILALGTTTADRTFTDAAGITIGSDGGTIATNGTRNFTIASLVNFGANTLTINSTSQIAGVTRNGTVSIGNANNGFTGTGAINVVNGTLRASGGTGTAYSAGSINLTSGTTFDTTTGTVINAEVIANGSATIRANIASTTASAKIGSATSTSTTSKLILGAATANTASVALQVGSNNMSSTFAGIISQNITSPGGVGSIEKVGNGTWTLTNTNTYTGGTTITGGTILASNSSGTPTASATGSGPVTVGAFGTLGGTGRVGGAVTVNSGGTLAPGASAGTLSINNDLTFLDGANLAYEIGATPGTSDLIDLTSATSTVAFGSTLNLNISTIGAADPTGQQYVLINYNGANPGSLPTINFTGPLTGDVAIDTVNTQIVLTNVVPEPASLGLLAAAAGLGLLARRRRRHA